MPLAFPSRFAATFLLCIPLASADEVTLKDGRIIEGEVTQEDDKVVKVKLRKGAMTIDRKDVVTIVRKATPEQEYNQRKAKLAAGDARARLDLALWCSGKKLEPEAIALLLEAHKLDPTLGAAAVELTNRDYHLVDGVWQDPDTYYAGKGWQKLGSKWYHPLEYAWRLADQDAARAKGALDAHREALQAAQAAVKRTRGLADAERKKLEDLSIDLAAANQGLLKVKTDLDNATLKRSQAEAAVKQGEVDFEDSKPGEGGSLDGLQQIRKLRRELAAAQGAEARAKKAFNDQEKKVAGLEAQVVESRKRGVDLESDWNGAAGKVTQLEGETAGLEDAQAKAKAKAAEARAAWDKAPK